MIGNDQTRKLVTFLIMITLPEAKSDTQYSKTIRNGKGKRMEYAVPFRKRTLYMFRALGSTGLHIPTPMHTDRVTATLCLHPLALEPNNFQRVSDIYSHYKICHFPTNLER
jgi:hypothetical protein